MNAKNFEKAFNCLSIALSLAKCSQTCIVYVASVEKTLNFVIQDLNYQFLSMDQCSFHLSTITSNAKSSDTIIPPTKNSQENCKEEVSKTYTWKAKVTSFTTESAVQKNLANIKKCESDPKPNKGATLTFY